jgi:hypothetical protein
MEGFVMCPYLSQRFGCLAGHDPGRLPLAPGHLTLS